MDGAGQIYGEAARDGWRSISSAGGSLLRVLVLTPEYAPHAWGGLGTYLHEVVSRLVARGVHVDVLLAPTYAPRTDSVFQEGLPRALIVDADDPPEAHAAAIEREWGGRYDVAFVQDPHAAQLSGILLSRSVCRRVVSTAHLPTYSGCSYFDKPEDDVRHQALEALLFRISDRIVAPSNFAADVLIRVHRLALKDITVLTYGSPPVEPTVRSRDAGDPLKVLSVGRIAKQKGMEDLCDISALVPEGVASFAHLGSARKGGTNDVLRDSRIAERGYRPFADVLEHLLRSDIVLSTSVYETFGLSLLEGMTAGAVPVAFECGAYDEFIEHGVSGIIVAPGDVNAAAQAIEALGRDAEQLRCLAEGAVSAANRFSWEDHVDGLEVVLAGV
jgi:glycosyltransferase involved in cell wall biosynthesis